MSMTEKAVEMMLEKASELPEYSETTRPDTYFKSGFRLGYHQAEKDLELTWEDMMLIHRCIKDAMNYHLYKMMEGVEGQKVIYQEVLKRFKDYKTEKYDTRR